MPESSGAARPAGGVEAVTGSNGEPLVIADLARDMQILSDELTQVCLREAADTQDAELAEIVVDIRRAAQALAKLRERGPVGG